jgi:hypothetical protein
VIFCPGQHFFQQFRFTVSVCLFFLQRARHCDVLIPAAKKLFTLSGINPLHDMANAI